MRRTAFILLLMILTISFSTVYAEIDSTRQYFSTDINDCYTTDPNGWINGMNATYEISVKDATLFGAEYFMTYAFFNEMQFVTRVFDSTNYTIEGKWAPYSVARVYYDFTGFSALPSYAHNAIPVMIGADIDPEKADKKILETYEKGVTVELVKHPTDHLLINEYAKQIPVDGLYFIMYFPDNYNYYDIQRYGIVLDYLTQFVHEFNEAGIDFFELSKTFTTDGNQHIYKENTAFTTKDGYSIGILATEKFIFAAVTDADDYTFSDKEAVISYYTEKYDKANLRLVAYQ